MEGGIGWIILLIVVAWAGHAVYQGYRKETAPPLPTITTGEGMKVPVCSRCGAGLVTLERHSHGAIASLFGGLALLSGVAVMLLANAIAGLILMVVGLLVILAGKSRRTVLTCPACGQDARTLT